MAIVKKKKKTVVLSVFKPVVQVKAAAHTVIVGVEDICQARAGGVRQK